MESKNKKYQNQDGKLPHEQKGQGLINQQQQSIFHDFYLKLKSDKAEPVRKAIETFVKNKLPKLIKQNDVSREDQGLEVQQLMSEMTEKFMQVFPVKGNPN